MKKIEIERPSAEALIFNLIRTEGPLSRTDIVTRTGFSKSTVSLQVSRFIQRGLVQEEASEFGEGKKKRPLQVCGGAGYVVGAFLGMHKLSITLFNLTLDPLKEVYYNLDSVIEPETTNNFIMEKISNILDDAKLRYSDLWGIGLGFPFPVDFDQGIPDSPPNLPLWHLYPLCELYEKKFCCPVLIDNDVNVMALGESVAGIAQNTQDFIFLKVGTGIGAGLFLEGRVYRGSKGCAGDIGHIAIDGETKLCHCGNQGCLETITAAPAIARKGLDVALTEESYVLASILKKHGRIVAEDVGNAALRGDMFAIQIMQESGRKIGLVLAKLVNFTNPDMIVIGGGVAQAGNIFLGAVREAILGRSLHLATIDLKIYFSELMEKSGTIGAGSLILERIFSPPLFQETITKNL